MKGATGALEVDSLDVCACEDGYSWNDYACIHDECGQDALSTGIQNYDGSCECKDGT